MNDGGVTAVGSDEPVVGSSEVKWLEDRVRELERLLGRKTMENEILREALAKALAKTDVAAAVAAEGRFPVKRVAEVLGISRSNLIERSQDRSKSRGPYEKAGNVMLLPLIRRLVDERPTYGYRRIMALLNRELARTSPPPANRKRVHRIMQRHALLLERHTGRRERRVHDGKVAVMRSNLRWCSDGLEFACWDGAIVRMAFIIGAFDREIIAFTGVSSAGISGSHVRDMMLEAVEARFGAARAPHPIEHLSDNGSPYTAKDTRDFAAALNLVSCFTPVKSPESNAICEAFVKTFKRDYVRISPLPDAPSALRQIAGWIEDYNEIHPHSSLKIRFPREFILEAAAPDKLSSAKVFKLLPGRSMRSHTAAPSC